jgi:hypothetical protein
MRTRKRKNILSNKTIKNKNNNHSYTLNDYNSNDGMLTSIWGPSTWHLLHCLSFNYPIEPTEKDKIEYRNFILSMKNVLPCGKCRKNLTNNFKLLPLNMCHMKSRETFSKYVFDLHEVINKMLCKKSGLTYEDVRNTYEHFRARCMKTEPTKKNEKGCVVPFYGKRTKCVLRIVPQSKQCKSFTVGA